MTNQQAIKDLAAGAYYNTLCNNEELQDARKEYTTQASKGVAIEQANRMHRLEQQAHTIAHAFAPRFMRVY